MSPEKEDDHAAEDREGFLTWDELMGGEGGQSLLFADPSPQVRCPACRLPLRPCVVRGGFRCGCDNGQ